MPSIDTMAWDFTPGNLAAYGLDPIIPGEYTRLRFQYRRAGAAASLEGAILVWTVRRAETLLDADVLMRRTSLDPIASWTNDPAQILIDANQADEDVEAETGRGWYTLILAPPDEAEVATLTGRRSFYDVRAKFLDGSVKTLLRGRLQAAASRTKLSQFP